ncbi:hypothetical protein [Paracoccus sp. ME4]|uniref:hypothetical protein n=1 Tax=Paracoccus sp. ME4 TaxID=3138066 RepID=UPI00398BA1E4
MNEENFQIGDVLRHVRRGSTYRILDRFRAGFHLDDEATLCLRRGSDGTVELLHGDFPGSGRRIMVQIDRLTAQSAVTGDWFLYESMDEPDMAFIRPVVEFGGDRFVAA